MDLRDIARLRLARQGISAPRFENAESVVRWLCAVQSQEYDAARWSLGQRTADTIDASVEQALADGRILRTHVLRPTWHFVLPEDARWLIELTAPRIRQAMVYYDRQLEIDAALRARSAEVIQRAIEGRGAITRNEVGQELAANGIAASGQRLGQLLMHAELDCLVCSGPRRGKQQTYALFSRRATGSKSISRDEGLEALSRRYFGSHGPATARDFATWANLTLTDARRGLEMLGSDAESLVVNERTYWLLGDSPVADVTAPRAHLLQGYDEYIMGYFETKDVFGVGSLGSLPPGTVPMSHAVVVDGLVAGHWKRNLSAKTVSIDMQLYRGLDGSEMAALENAVERYGAFVGLPASIGLVDAPES